MPVDMWVLAGIFPPAPVCPNFHVWTWNSNLFLLRNFLKTSMGLNWVIRTPIFENSDSISRIFPRRTQWHSPFPLIQILELDSASIYVTTGYWKYGLLHSPLLKGFRPRNLQVRKNVSYHPIIHLLKASSTSNHCPYKILNAGWIYAKVCVYVLT